MIIICLSIYNGTPFLKEQLASLENQSFRHDEITLLARDDGSSDDSFLLINQFASKSSIRTVILQERTNYGIKKSFELLMHTALQMDAEYIMFSDQDDIWNKDKIEKTSLKMKEMENKYPHLPILVHTDLTVVNGQMDLLNNSFWKYQNMGPSKNALRNFITDNNVTGCSLMINQTLAKRINIIPESAIMHDWWISLVASAFGHIGVVSESTILYRQHNANDTGAKKFGWRHILERFQSRPTLDKYFIQAKAFFDCYRDQLNPSQQRMFNDLTKWEKVGFWKRRWLIIRYGLWKKGVIRNIGLMVFA